MVRAKGDSMSPNIEDKDLVLFEKQPDVEDGNIALVIDNGEPKIKKLFKKSKGQYILSSINKNHADKTIRLGRDFRILGLGKAVIRGL